MTATQAQTPQRRATKTPDTYTTTTTTTTPPQRQILTSSREVTGLDTPALTYQQQQLQNHHHHGSGFHIREKAHEKVGKNLRKRYAGKWTLYNFHRVFLPRQPASVDPETVAQRQVYDYDEAKTWDEPKGQVVKNAEGMYEYRNEFYQIDQKFVDTAVYLSPTNYVPRRLVVQATGQVLDEVENGADTGDWIRTRISGNVPLILTISEWALRPLEKGRWWNKLDAGLRLVIVSFPLQLMLVLPGFSSYDDAEIADSYTDHPGYHCKLLTRALPLCLNSPWQAPR